MVTDPLTWRISSCSLKFIYPVGPSAWPEMLIGGSWQPAASGRTEDVTSPFDGTVIGTVERGAADARAALDRAEQGAVAWRRTRPSSG